MNRTTGNLPISIATSSAIEKILDPNESTKNVVRQSEKLLMSLETLYRNCVDSHRGIDITTNLIADSLMRDIEFIVDELERNNNKLKPCIYLADNTDIKRKFSVAQFRTKTNRDSQKEYVKEGVFDLLLGKVDFIKGRYYDLDFGLTENTNALLITHLPYELLRFQYFTNLVLVESHTGNFKYRSAWYTKLYNGNKLIPLPFNQLTLNVFGDPYLFKPLKTLIPLVKKIAESFMWRSDTSYTKVKESIFKYSPQKDENKTDLIKIIKE